MPHEKKKEMGEETHRIRLRHHKTSVLSSVNLYKQHPMKKKDRQALYLSVTTPGSSVTLELNFPCAKHSVRCQDSTLCGKHQHPKEEVVVRVKGDSLNQKPKMLTLYVLQSLDRERQRAGVLDLPCFVQSFYPSTIHPHTHTCTCLHTRTHTHTYVHTQIHTSILPFTHSPIHPFTFSQQILCIKLFVRSRVKNSNKMLIVLLKAKYVSQVLG